LGTLTKPSNLIKDNTFFISKLIKVLDLICTFYSQLWNKKIIISEMLWVAPELLPLTDIPGHPATQKGDVYSFSIILEEIVVRGGPYILARQFMSVQGK
jgi:hypothetical protein